MKDKCYLPLWRYLAAILALSAAIDRASAIEEYLPVSIEQQVANADLVVRAEINRISPLRTKKSSAQCGWQISAVVKDVYKGNVSSVFNFYATREIVEYRSVKTGDELLLLLNKRSTWTRFREWIFGDAHSNGEDRCTSDSADLILTNKNENAFPIVKAKNGEMESILYWADRTVVKAAEASNADRSSGCAQVACPIQPWSAPLTMVVRYIRVD